MYLVLLDNLPEISKVFIFLKSLISKLKFFWLFIRLISESSSVMNRVLFLDNFSFSIKMSCNSELLPFFKLIDDTSWFLVKSFDN